MGLFEHDENHDGVIQKEEWVEYYVSRANEIKVLPTIMNRVCP